MESTKEELLENLALELRRGALTLAVVTFSLALAFVITVIAGGIEDIGSLAWASGRALAQGALMAFASLTLIFAAAERFYAHRTSTEEDEEWDPFDLDPVEEPDRIKRPELVAGIVWSFFAHHPVQFLPSLDRHG